MRKRKNKFGWNYISIEKETFLGYEASYWHQIPTNFLVSEENKYFIYNFSGFSLFFRLFLSWYCLIDCWEERGERKNQLSNLLFQTDHKLSFFFSFSASLLLSVFIYLNLWLLSLSFYVVHTFFIPRFFSSRFSSILSFYLSTDLAFSFGLFRTSLCFPLQIFLYPFVLVFLSLRISLFLSMPTSLVTLSSSFFTSLFPLMTLLFFNRLFLVSFFSFSLSFSSFSLISYVIQFLESIVGEH